MIQVLYVEGRSLAELETPASDTYRSMIASVDLSVVLPKVTPETLAFQTTNVEDKRHRDK